MTTPTLTTPAPDDTDHTTHIDIRVSVTADSPIEVFVFGNGAEVDLGTYRQRVRLHGRNDDLNPEKSLAVLEDYLERARLEVTRARLRLHPCGGVCSPALWPPDGWICAAHNSDLDATCTRVEGHDGPHIACTPDQHNAASWPGRKAA